MLANWQERLQTRVSDEMDAQNMRRGFGDRCQVGRNVIDKEYGSSCASRQFLDGWPFGSAVADDRKVQTAGREVATPADRLRRRDVRQDNNIGVVRRALDRLRCAIDRF